MPGEPSVIGADEFTFAVRDREFHRIDAGRPDAFVRARCDMHPAAEEPAAIVVGQCAALASHSPDTAGQQIRFDEHLKSVADPQDRLAGRDELVERLGEAMGDSIGENAAGGDVVAVAESAGNREQLVIVQRLAVFQKAIQMQKSNVKPG